MKNPPKFEFRRDFNLIDGWDIYTKLISSFTPVKNKYGVVSKPKYKNKIYWDRINYLNGIDL